jgi:hypothetical protein
MAEHRKTPDVLADILSGDVPIPAPGTSLPIGSVADLPPRRPAPRTNKPKPEPGSPAALPTTGPKAWEYEIVSFQNAHGWRPRFVNGRELRDWMFGSLIHDYVNQRSADGWELAAVASGESLYGTSDRYQIYFRRPRQ